MYQPLETWNQPPAAKLSSKVRAIVVLENRGPRPAEGVLLRYAISGRPVPVAAPQEEGAWVVPYWEEERRVPFIRANQVKEIPMELPRLGASLKGGYSEGFWPRELKLQIMVVPRRGETLERHILEKTLPLSWNAASPGLTR